MDTSRQVPTASAIGQKTLVNQDLDNPGMCQLGERVELLLEEGLFFFVYFAVELKA
jgi:hypothetical protein